MDLQSRYDAAFAYLNSFIDYSLVSQKEMAAAKFELGRIFALAESLGNPQQSYPSIHVAGSKGKGSVSALCASALQAQGYRVGLYTSPHLSVFEERIQVNRQMITREEVVELVDEIKPHVAKIPGLTTFEITTVMAFWYFARQKVDAAVIEVGLGGRLDPTNIVIPTVSVITPIQLEHTAILGDTLAKIATEKAGIIKPGVPVVVSPQKEEAWEVILEKALRLGSGIVPVGKDYLFGVGRTTLAKQAFWVREARKTRKVHLEMKLLGPHQVENAATAYAALKSFHSHGLVVTQRAIRRGFAGAEWPARFEVMNQTPPLVMDGAHTPDAARRLRETLEILFPGQGVVLVLGVSEDKNVSAMLAELLPVTREIIFTRSNHPRAMPVERLLELSLPAGMIARGVEKVGEALEVALQAAGDAPVLVTGSLFVAGNARDAWLEKHA